MWRSAALGMLLLGLVWTSWAREISRNELDKKLCGMAQYESGLTQTMGQVPQNQGPGIQYVSMHFDAINKRMMLNLTKIDLNGVKTAFEVQIRQDLMFIFLPTYKACLKARFPAPIDNCLPAGATIIGKRRYGDTKAPLYADVITFHTELPGYGDLYSEMSVTSEESGRVPIASVTMGKLEGVPYLRSDEYYGVTEGIKDTSVFDLRPECKKPSELQDKEIIKDIKVNPFLRSYRKN